MNIGYNTSLWLIDVHKHLTEHNIDTFIYRTLPHELKHINMIMKAKNNGYLKAIRRTYPKKWQITHRGYIYLKKYGATE